MSIGFIITTVIITWAFILRHTKQITTGEHIIIILVTVVLRFLMN